MPEEGVPEWNEFCRDLVERLVGRLGLAENQVNDWVARAETSANGKIVRAEKKDDGNTVVQILLHKSNGDLTMVAKCPEGEAEVVLHQGEPCYLLEPWAAQRLAELKQTFLET